MSKNETPIALVSGASDGIGKETARQLASRNIRVFLGSRSLNKEKDAVDEFGQVGLVVELLELDMTNTASIESAAREVDQRYGRLDILINNAGIALD